MLQDVVARRLQFEVGLPIGMQQFTLGGGELTALSPSKDYAHEISLESSVVAATTAPQPTARILSINGFCLTFFHLHRFNVATGESDLT